MFENFIKHRRRSICTFCVVEAVIFTIIWRKNLISRPIYPAHGATDLYKNDLIFCILSWSSFCGWGTLYWYRVHYIGIGYIYVFKFEMIFCVNYLVLTVLKLGETWVGKWISLSFTVAYGQIPKIKLKV